MTAGEAIAILQQVPPDTQIVRWLPDRLYVPIELESRRVYKCHGGYSTLANPVLNDVEVLLVK